MTSRALIYSTRATGSNTNQSIFQQMAIVKTKNTHIDLLSAHKTTKGMEFIKNAAKIQIENQIDDVARYYHDSAIKMSSWEEIYKNMNVDFLKKYSDLYLFGGIFSPTSNLARGLKRNGIFPKDSGQITFQSVAVPTIHILALLKANREFGINLHEVIWDPLEMSLDLFHEEYKPHKNYHLYFAYDSPSLNIKRLDSLQFYLQEAEANKSSLFDFSVEKDIDITFGLTVVEKKRQKYWDDAKQILSNFNTPQFYGRNKFTDEDNFLDRDSYLGQIKRSKYTLIVPSYYEPSFSILRFIESLHNDCLPLIHSDCVIDDVSTSYGVDLSELKVTQPFPEEQREILLEKYKKVFLSVEKTFM